MLGVKVVERHAFSYCDLATVQCGKLERIEEGVFGYCRSLRSIDLSSAKIVGEYSFAHCAALKSAIFGDKLESIRGWHSITAPLWNKSPSHETWHVCDDDNIFNGCFNLKRVDLVGGVHETVRFANGGMEK